MIQRIQTVWLFIAAILVSMLFMVDIYKFDSLGLGIGNDYLSIALSIASIVLILFTIFKFKHRKQQLNFIWLTILVLLGLLFSLYFRIENAKSTQILTNGPGYFWIGSFLPLASIVFLFMARSGIKKDEKVIKSLDRLR